MASNRSGDRCSSLVWPGTEVDRDGGGGEYGGENARSASRCSTMVLAGGVDARQDGDRDAAERDQARWWWARRSTGMLVRSKAEQTLDSSA